MMHIGVDIEQFVRDPYGSGIQRVLQYLAREWPSESVRADFVAPIGDGFGLLTPVQAAEVLSIPFLAREPGSDLRALVRDRLAALDPVCVRPGDLLSIYDSWLLPEVSYLPRVLERFELFAKCMPTAMIGYDTLPMSDPANYRFTPGSAAWVSEYFRLLASTDSVVCISGYARDSILRRLRRDPALPISVAHPGGDHLAVRAGMPGPRPLFARLGTLEARKRPLEILTAFLDAVTERGVEADLLFIGSPSSSDSSINRRLRGAIDAGHPVRWVTDAADEEVYGLVNSASAFLSIGTEGYGIPVLESIRLGTPVLFDGIQPAGDLMTGRGARRVDAVDHLIDVFVRYSMVDSLSDLRAELQPDSVPTWTEFASSIAAAVQVR